MSRGSVWTVSPFIAQELPEREDEMRACHSRRTGWVLLLTGCLLAAPAWGQAPKTPSPAAAPAPAPKASAPVTASTPAQFRRIPLMPPHPSPYLPDAEASGMRFVFGIFGGLALYSDNLDLGNNNARSGLTPAPGSVFGARLGAELGYYALHVEGTFAESTYDKGAETANLQSLRALLLAHVSVGPLRPFLLAGGGFHALTNDPDHLESDIDATLHVGLGTRWQLSEWLSLRAEARAIGSDGFDPGSFSVSWEFLLGLSTRFAKSVQPDP